MFLVIFAALAMANLVWWLWADSRARRRPRARVWRTLIALFTAVQLAYLAYFLVAPVSARHAHRWMPSSLLAAVYLWHLLVLPATFLTILIGGLVKLAVRGVQGVRAMRSRATDDRSEAPSEPGASSPAKRGNGEEPVVTRRHIL